MEQVTNMDELLSFLKKWGISQAKFAEMCEINPNTFKCKINNNLPQYKFTDKETDRIEANIIKLKTDCSFVIISLIDKKKNL